jgi:DNA-binding LacI/PurR family transcriptional regulator
MEDYKIDIMVGKGPSAKSLRLDLPKFTLIGATTRAGALSAPLRDRFGMLHRLEFYSEPEMVEILRRAATILDITIDDRQAESITSRGIALATVGTAVEGHPSVRIDDVGVGRLAAEHLIGLGHERIAVLGGHPESPLCFDVPAFRWQGFSSAMSDAGLAVPAGPDANGGFTIDGGYEAMISILARRELPTAVFAMSDEMAFGALIACNEHSIVVGADLSIIGVDDHEFSRVVELTTISQPVADHGSHAARLLIARIEGDQQLAVAAGVSSAPDPVGSSSICPEVHLVERSTTGRVHVGAGGENVART